LGEVSERVKPQKKTLSGGEMEKQFNESGWKFEAITGL